ncbi:DUF4129 domain-containing protein [Phytomonospora sp. NPDC050363]|uniref:DUF4129 domain-containing protein n=1 Tax=Phytomonospora sp. NPDC050363 TaxID=3155642 RepID=UPI0033DC1394
MAQLRRWAPLLVIAALVMLIAGAASIVDLKAADVDVPRLDEILDISQQPTEEEETREVPPPDPDGGGAAEDGVHPFLLVLGGVLLTFVFGILAVVIYMLLRHYLTQRRYREITPVDFSDPGVEEEPGAEEVREAVRAGLADIDAGDDPRKAVIACWLSLERAAAKAGTARAESETPGDLVTRLLAAHNVNDQALALLTNSYRQARYAPDEVTEQLRSDARQALIEIDAQLAEAARQAREARETAERETEAVA